jgi:hypothetical protein
MRCQLILPDELSSPEQPAFSTSHGAHLGVLADAIGREVRKLARCIQQRESRASHMAQYVGNHRSQVVAGAQLQEINERGMSEQKST